MTSGFTLPNVPLWTKPHQRDTADAVAAAKPHSPAPRPKLRNDGRRGRSGAAARRQSRARAATDRSMSAICPQLGSASRPQGGAMALSAVLGVVAAAAVAALVIMVGLAGGWRGEPRAAGGGAGQPWPRTPQQAAFTLRWRATWVTEIIRASLLVII